jgi:membrane-associated protease RseP (regulator of RpoE activity)
MPATPLATVMSNEYVAGGPATDAPAPERLADVFRVERVRRDDDRLVYVGEPLVGPDELERRVYPAFRDAGYDVRLTTVQESEPDPISGVQLRSRHHALVAQPADLSVDSVPWTNVLMLALTVLTTLFAGSMWYYEPLTAPLDLFTGQKWKFTAAVLSVLGVHELGHYVLSRYHRVNASLPYFIPIPSFIGTLGAVIRMKGRIPDRKALFDIGVAGPLAGLIAAVVVSLIGLYLPPIEVPQAVLDSPSAVEIKFGYPPLLQALSEATGQPLVYDDPGRAVNPVVFGGWVGMFVTFLNLIPVGQLDGGHITRAMFGARAESIAALVPAALLGLAGYLYLFAEVGANAPFLWGFWGIVTLGLAYVGSAEPVFDEPLNRGRVAVGAVTFVLGALCFVPVPFELLG